MYIYLYTMNDISIYIIFNMYIIDNICNRKKKIYKCNISNIYIYIDKICNIYNIIYNIYVNV